MRKDNLTKAEYRQKLYQRMWKQYPHMDDRQMDALIERRVAEWEATG